MATTDAAMEDRFRQLFERHHAEVAAYVTRRASASIAEDVVEETFLVVWRSLERVPDDALPWLYGVARHTLANHLRAMQRRRRLIRRLASERHEPQSEPLPGLVSARLRQVLLELSDAEREAILLIAWEELTPSQAARAAGCSSATFRVRLHRARRHLERALSTDPPLAPRITQEEA
jgi:RNA polymerase sigma-70 factor (ECF subfamily)